MCTFVSTSVISMSVALLSVLMFVEDGLGVAPVSPYSRPTESLLMTSHIPYPQDFSFSPPAETDMPVMPEWLVRGANAFAVHSLFHTMNVFDQMRHRSSERVDDVEVMRDIHYAEDSPTQRLDVWRPATPSSSPRPALLFVHGGGFRTMSKRTHWFFARTFARMGFVVFTIDYRMGPNHPYPEPLMDAASALEWVAAHAEEYGADLDQLVFAGESAGANLVTALTAMCVNRQGHTDWMQRVFDLGVTPRALLPMCGILQVSDPDRHLRRGVPRVVMGPLRGAKRAYLGEAPREAASLERASSMLLADPLRFFERRDTHDRPLPALMLNVGGLDPLVDDSRRLARAWGNTTADLRIYPRSGHSFMAFMWTGNAMSCWDDIDAFLTRQHILPAPYQPARLSA